MTGNGTGRLTAETLTLAYGGFEVARDLSLSLPDGQITTIIGPNAAKATASIAPTVATKAAAPIVADDAFADAKYRFSVSRASPGASRRVAASRSL